MHPHQGDRTLAMTHEGIRPVLKSVAQEDQIGYRKAFESPPV